MEKIGALSVPKSGLGIDLRRLSGKKRDAETLSSVVTPFKKTPRISRPFWRKDRKLKIVARDYLEKMFLHVMRDGEVSPHERQLVQMSVFFFSQLAQSRFADEMVRLPHPAAFPSYTPEELLVEFPGIRKFLDEVGTNVVKKLEQEGRDCPTGIDDMPWEEHVANSVLSVLSRMVSKQGRLGWLRPRAEDLAWWCMEREDGPYIGSLIRKQPPGMLKFFFDLFPDDYLAKANVYDAYSLFQHNVLSIRHSCYLLLFIVTTQIYTLCKRFFLLAAFGLQFRMLVCYASHIPVLGHAVEFMASFVEFTTDWSPDHWLLGCPAEVEGVFNYDLVSKLVFVSFIVRSLLLYQDRHWSQHFLWSILPFLLSFTIERALAVQSYRHHAQTVESIEKEFDGLSMFQKMFTSPPDTLDGHKETHPILVFLQDGYHGFCTTHLALFLFVSHKFLMEGVLTAVFCSFVKQLASMMQDVVQPLFMLWSFRLGSDARKQSKKSASAISASPGAI